MLNGFPILIVEDEPVIALALVTAIEELDGLPVGPVATVAVGLALLDLERIAAATVDANLDDRDVKPLALALIARGLPFVFTGHGLAILHPDLPAILKPARSTEVLATLLHQVSPSGGCFEAGMTAWKEK